MCVCLCVCVQECVREEREHTCDMQLNNTHCDTEQMQTHRKDTVIVRYTQRSHTVFDMHAQMHDYTHLLVQCTQ